MDLLQAKDFIINNRHTAISVEQALVLAAGLGLELVIEPDQGCVSVDVIYGKYMEFLLGM